MGSWKALGDWGECFFDWFRTNQLILMGVYGDEKTQLLEMDYNNKTGEGYAGEYGKTGQEAGIDFLEIRSTNDGGKYAHAYEIKTDNGALCQSGTSRKDGGGFTAEEKTRAINETLRPYERTAEGAEIKPSELRGWGNLFIETKQKTKEGWYPVIARNRKKLDTIFPKEAGYPHIEGRDVVEILVRPDGNGGANAFLLFIPDAKLVSIVEGMKKKGLLEEKPGGNGAMGYPVPIPAFYAKPYKKAFKQIGRKARQAFPFLPENAEALTMGRWGRRFEKGIGIYAHHMTAKEIKVYAEAVKGNFTKPERKPVKAERLEGSVYIDLSPIFDAIKNNGEPWPGERVSTLV